MAFPSPNMSKTDLTAVSTILGVVRHSDDAGGVDMTRLRIDISAAYAAFIADNAAKIAEKVAAFQSEVAVVKAVKAEQVAKVEGSTGYRQGRLEDRER